MGAFRSLAIAFAASALLQNVQAWNIDLPPCTTSFKPFTSVGCYAESNPNTLSFRSDSNQQNMTVENCQAECKGNGFKYAGLEYYGICFCGNSINGPKLDDSQCTFKCSGNKAQTCGGNNKLNIYEDTTFPVVDVNDVSDYKSLGCYFDGSKSGRTLSYPQDSVNGDGMTTQKCLAACKAGGYPYAGTEYGQECWCGTVFNNDTYSTAASECNMPCKGDTSQMCGGRTRLSLYFAADMLSSEPCGSIPTLPFPTSSSSSAPASPSTSAVSSSTSTSEAATTSTTTSDVETSTSSTEISTSSTEVSTSTAEISTSTTEISTSTSETSTSTAEASTSRTETSTSEVETLTSTTESSSSTVETSSTIEPTTTSEASTSATPSSTTSSTTLSTIASTTSTPSSTPVSTTKATTSSTTQPPVTTRPPTTTTRATSTSTSICYSTTTIPSTCEYKCGSWCNKELPDFDDQTSCKTALANCKIQLASCFKNAGWPAALECFNFASWCGDIDDYCSVSPLKVAKFGKSDCVSKNPPKGNPPTTKTITVPCAPTGTTTKKTTTTSATPTPTKCPIPTVSNICKQPSSWLYGYGPGNPVGGIELPVVTCNDLKNDHSQNPFKLYTEVDSNKCNSYPRPQCGNACADACKVQYDECVDTYAESCKPTGSSNQPNFWDQFFGKTSRYRRDLHARTAAWSDNYSGATNKCKYQYNDCLSENRYVTGAGKCGAWGSGW